MKKLLLGVIAFALIITSCNKYEDEFNDLNAKLDALKAQVAGVAALQTGITALQSQVTALSAAVAALPNPTTSIATLTTNLATLTTKVATVQTALDKLAVDVAAGKVTSDAAAVKVAEMQAALVLAQADIVKILANTSMYVGDVSITTDIEVDFWTPKVSQLGMINGDLYINTTDISDARVADMNNILKNINAVIGSGICEITAASGKQINLSNLTSVVATFIATGDVGVTQDIMNLSKLGNVTGDFYMDFDGPYGLPLLSNVGGSMYLINYGVDEDLSPLGTTSVNFPLVSVKGNLIYSNFPLATTVNVGGNMTTFSAAIATTVTLRNNYIAGLAFSAPKATSVSIAAKSAGGDITISAEKATSVSLANLETAGNIIITMDKGTVNLNVFESDVSVTITGPETLSLPKYVSGKLTCNSAKTVTLASHDGVLAPTLNIVETLTMGALNAADFNITAYPKLKVASITGNSDEDNTSTVAGVTSASNSTVTSLTLAGPMVTVNINGQSKLTSLATSGIINSLTLDNCDALTAVNFAHTHFVGGTLGTGSVLVVQNNLKLAALTTSSNFMRTLTVKDNAALASMNFVSYVDILYPGSSVGITISGNKISGSYTAAVSVTPTTPFVEAIVKSNDLLTLKAYAAKLAVAVSALTITVPTFFLDVDDVDATTEGNQKLSAVMSDIAIPVTRPTVVDAIGGINTFPEMALVVAQ